MEPVSLLFAGLTILAVGIFLGVCLRDELADDENDRLVVFAAAAMDCKNYWRARAEQSEQITQPGRVPDGLIEADGPLTQAERDYVAQVFRQKVEGGPLPFRPIDESCVLVSRTPPERAMG